MIFNSEDPGCNCPPPPEGIRNKLIWALESVSRRNVSNTSTEVLADYLLDCLESYERAVIARDEIKQNKANLDAHIAQTKGQP